MHKFYKFFIYPCIRCTLYNVVNVSVPVCSQLLQIWHEMQCLIFFAILYMIIKPIYHLNSSFEGLHVKVILQKVSKKQEFIAYHVLSFKSVVNPLSRHPTLKSGKCDKIQFINNIILYQNILQFSIYCFHQQLFQYYPTQLPVYCTETGYVI